LCLRSRPNRRAARSACSDAVNGPSNPRTYGRRAWASGSLCRQHKIASTLAALSQQSTTPYRPHVVDDDVTYFEWRWRGVSIRPRGFVAPERISSIPLAEESGLIVEMGEWDPLEGLSREAASWQAAADRRQPTTSRRRVHALRRSSGVCNKNISVLLETGLNPGRWT